MTTSETYPPTDPERLAFHTDIRETIQRYLELFPNEEDRQEELQSKLANPDLDLRLRSTIPDGHMCASGIILLPDSKILMLEHKALGIWVVPGGHYDLVDENLSATAIRETVEETGILKVTLHPWHIEHGIPLDIDTHPIPERKEKGEGAHQHFDFRYILEIADPEQTIETLRLDPNEVLSFKVVNITEVDPASSIAPALKKLGLITG